MISSARSLSRVQLFATPWTVARQASLSITNSRSLFKLMLLSRWCHSTISCSVVPFSSSFNLSQHQNLLQWVSSSHQGEKILQFQLQISPSSEYSGLISLKIHWFNLLAVQGTFRSLLQHHSLKASILWHSAFFTVQLSQPYMTTGKPCGLDYSRGLDYTHDLDHTDLCRQSKCLCFLICCLGWS